MTVTLNATAITLTGDCGVEEVEDLVNIMESQPELPVDLTAATSVHTALWQALMVFRPRLAGLPVSPSIERKVVRAVSPYFRENTE
jgi:hypothetical protein